MGQTEVRKAMTYIESKNGLKELSAEYTEDALQHRFSSMIDELSGELRECYEQSEELEAAGQDIDWNSDDQKMPLLAKKILADKADLKRRRDAAQKSFDSAVMYENWLNEYGSEFAHLLSIKDRHEERGYDENLEIREIDITDNGDMLTNDKYNKMNAYAPEPLTELVLHVTGGEDEDSEKGSSESFGFNFGVMEFNQPNMPPQTKIQLSFDDDTIDNLNEAKLKRVFAFCDTHGIPVSELQIRHFDGSVAEDLIREKIEQYLEKIKADKENRNRLEDKREKAKENARRQELEAEKQKLLTEHPDKADELSWEKGDISPDLVPEHRVMKANSNQAPMAHEFVNQGELPTAERGKAVLAEKRSLGPNDKLFTEIQDTQISDYDNQQAAVQTISKGVAAPEIVPTQEMTREIIENAKATAKAAAENSATAPKENIIGESAKPENAQTITPENAQTTQSAARSQSSNRQQATTPPPPAAPNLKMSEVEKSFESLFEKGWGKRNKLSYFKEYTGWFKSGWTEYIFYDNEDKDNRKKDGMEQKDKSVKYTYSFKLFLKMEKDGLHFTYRTPNHRKIDEKYINDIVGKLKDLGYTHINFPAGLTNEEKGMWRKAMAENNIVPLNLGLNVKHAHGMIEDMKKTEKYDAKDIAEYGKKIAEEMKRADAKDHKRPNSARKIFIDGLINTYKYFAFTQAYSEVLKSKVENMLRQPNPQTGSPNKFAAYLTLRRVFDVYKHALENGDSLLNVPEKIQVVTDEKTGATETITLLTPEEKRQIRDMGLGGNVQKLKPQQLDQLFDILYKRQTHEEYEKFKNLLWVQAFASNRGAKLAPNVVFSNELGYTQNEAKDIKRELEALGIEGFKPLEDTRLRMEFERFFDVEKPALERSQNSGSQQNGNTPTQPTPQSSQQSQQVYSSADRQQTEAVSPVRDAPVREQSKATENMAEHAENTHKKVVVRVVKVKKQKAENAPRIEKSDKKQKSHENTKEAIQQPTQQQPTSRVINETVAVKPQNKPTKVDVSRVVVKQNTNSL